MKKNISKITSQYKDQIALAKMNGFEAVMIPLNCEYDLYCLNCARDKEYMYEIALDCGWDDFLLINLKNSKKVVVDLHELDAA
ncbi:MAG: hypothetical protein U9N42_09200 [Campylobacterota bacterium]|nr:hypothetical protein [Campylobacterota bacterium]